MPGILYHLLFAKVASSGLDIRNFENFALGNLLPDSATDKRGAHYWQMPSDQYELKTVGFRVPDLALAQKALSSIENRDLALGIFGHLYLDKRFCEELVAKKFDWNADENIIYKRWDRSQSWTPEEFFSSEGMHRGYGESNPILFEDGQLSQKEVEKLPGEIPLTGIPVLDQRKPISWKDQLHGWLADPPRYTGKIFAYSELVGIVKKSAEDFYRDKSLWP